MALASAGRFSQVYSSSMLAAAPAAAAVTRDGRDGKAAVAARAVAVSALAAWSVSFHTAVGGVAD